MNDSGQDPQPPLVEQLKEKLFSNLLGPSIKNKLCELFH